MPSLDSFRRQHPWLLLAWLVVVAVAGVQVVRTSAFMINPSRTELSALPSSRFASEHSCLPLYLEAARRAGHQPIYQAPLAAESGDDKFQYPPAFLLLMEPLQGSAHPRALWYVINAIAITVAVWLSGRAALTLPLLWATLALPITLQIGNAHLLVVSAAFVAMWAFERERRWLGAALLSTAIVCKLFPAILLVVLVVQRRYLSAVLTLGACIAWFAAALWRFGTAPLQEFLGVQLGALFSGAAFAPYQIGSLAANHAPYALPLKLARLGVLPELPLFSTVIAALFGGVVLTLCITRRPKSPVAVLALLNLAALLAPFAPMVYTLVGSLWLLTLLAETRRIPALVMIGALACLYVPDSMPLSLVSQATVLALNLVVLCRARDATVAAQI